MRAPQVLVVDDDPVFRKLVCHALEWDGCQVWSADSGQEALEIAATYPPDVVISDEIMPRMTGIELCRMLKPSFSCSPLPFTVVATACPESDDPGHADEFGVDVYLDKAKLIRLLTGGRFRTHCLPESLRQQIAAEESFLEEVVCSPVASSEGVTAQ